MHIRIALIGLVCFSGSSWAMDNKKTLSTKEFFLKKQGIALQDYKKYPTIQFKTSDGKLNWYVKKEDLCNRSSYFRHLDNLDQLNCERNFEIDLEDAKRFKGPRALAQATIACIRKVNPSLLLQFQDSIMLEDGEKYVFDANVPNKVAKALVSYLAKPSLSTFATDLSTAFEIVQAWLQADYLGISILENRLGKHLVRLMKQDASFRNKIFVCNVKDGRVNNQELQKIFIEYFGGDTELLNLWLERYCLNNPRYWDSHVEQREIIIENARNLGEVQLSTTGRFVVIGVTDNNYLNTCLVYNKDDSGNFSHVSSLALEKPAMQGGSDASILFNSDDTYCVVYQKRDLLEWLQFYDCKSWKMIDDLKCVKKRFVGFDKENVIVLCDYDKKTLQFYDFVAKKNVHTCNVSGLTDHEDALTIREVVVTSQGLHHIFFDDGVLIGFDTECDISAHDTRRIDDLMKNFIQIDNRFSSLVSLDGKRLILVLDDDLVQVLDGQSGSCIKEFSYRGVRLLYDSPSQFKLAYVSNDGRSIVISFTAIRPGTRGSGIMDNAVVFDCDSGEIVQKFSDISSIDFSSDMSFYVSTKTDKGWFSSKSKVMVHGVTLQSILEKDCGKNIFGASEKTSLFSFLTKK